MILAFQHKLEIVFLCFAALLFFLEWRWGKIRNEKVHDWRETGANFSILAIYLVAKGGFLAWSYWVLSFFYRFRWFTPEKSLLLLAGTLFTVDFIYYIEHRALHVFRPLWTLHLVHHSGVNLNLTTSFRLNLVAPLVNVFFYVPMSLLGIDPRWTLFSVTIGIMYQYWLHTRFIGKLGFLEGMINTPSSHRVHHGSNPQYLDKNFGGMLMIWDRIFGTYEREGDLPKYGTIRGFVSNNPLKLLIHGFVELAKGELDYRG